MDGAEDGTVADGDDGGVSNLDKGASGEIGFDGDGGGDASFDVGFKSELGDGLGMESNRKAMGLARSSSNR